MVGGGGREYHHWESPQQRLSADFLMSWISSDLMKALHLWLGNLSDLGKKKIVIRISVENCMLDYAYPSWKSLGTHLTLFTSSLNNLQGILSRFVGLRSEWVCQVTVNETDNVSKVWLFKSVKRYQHPSLLF